MKLKKFIAFTETSLIFVCRKKTIEVELSLFRPLLKMSPGASFMGGKGVLVQLTFLLWLMNGEVLICRSAVLDRSWFHARSKYMMVTMPSIYSLVYFYICRNAI